MSKLNLEDSRNGRKQFFPWRFPLEHRHLLWTIALVLATMSFFFKPYAFPFSTGLVFSLVELHPSSLTTRAFFWTVFSVEQLGLFDGALTGVTRSPHPSSSERVSTCAKQLPACAIEPKLPKNRNWNTYCDHNDKTTYWVFSRCKERQCFPRCKVSTDTCQSKQAYGQIELNWHELTRHKMSNWQHTAAI